MEGQDRVLATAQQIVKSLHTSTNVNTDDMLLIFSSFDNRLSNLSNFMASSSATSTPSSAKADAAAADDDSFLDRRFEEAEKLILDAGVGDPASTEVYLAAEFCTTFRYFRHYAFQIVQNGLMTSTSCIEASSRRFCEGDGWRKVKSGFGKQDMAV
nr:exocyst complex component EXO70B1 [Ipomoea batatas]